MRSEPLAGIVSRLYDAALAPDGWTAVLQSLADVAGTLGAAYILSNKQTGRVEWASIAGYGTDATADYLGYYAARDPYRPLLEAAPVGEWMLLSRCLSQKMLRRDEWYNDYVAKLGVSDILAARLFDSATHTAIIGFHEGRGQRPVLAKALAPLTALFEPLSKAARLHAELGDLRCKSARALRALDQVALGVIIVHGDARVIEMNSGAERIIARGDGLAIRQGRLVARRAFEDSKLAGLVAGAAPARAEATAGRMLIARGEGRPAYALTAIPLGSDLGRGGGAHAMIMVADPERRVLAAADLTELFGLSPAESRLAASLHTGKRLCEIATDSGVRITTLRTQLSAILAKVGVERQCDLVRVLSSLALVSAQPWVG
jgi:DNA-binding CsgD family transcriptional regulator